MVKWANGIYLIKHRDSQSCRKSLIQKTKQSAFLVYTNALFGGNKTWRRFFKRRISESFNSTVSHVKPNKGTFILKDPVIKQECHQPKVLMSIQYEMSACQSKPGI